MKSKMNIKSILIMAIISLASMLFINISLAANTGTINVNVANLRREANAESTILEQITLNQEVEILGEEGDWYQVTYNQITGYVSKELVTVNSNPEPTEENNQVENSTQDNNQVETNTTEENTTEQNTTENTTAETTATEENAENTENTEEITLGEYKISEDTRLKLIPSINATDVIGLKADETVTVTEIMNGWACVETQTTKGWLRKDKLKKDEPVEANQEEVQEQQPAENTPIKTQYINSSTVNVRQEANTSSTIVTTASLNTEVQVYSEEGGWSRVRVNNVEGYIATSLLSDSRQETSRSQSTSRKTSSTKSTTSNTTSQSKTTQNTTTETTSVPSSSNGSAIVATAKKYLGYKYVYGGSSPSTGFDCSGFTSYVFKQHGITLNRTSAGQYSNGVAVSRSNLQPGDLVMFGKSSITHVAIYIGGGQIIHASTPSTGVRIDSLSTGYYNNNYYGARRVL